MGFGQVRGCVPDEVACDVVSALPPVQLLPHGVHYS